MTGAQPVPAEARRIAALALVRGFRFTTLHFTGHNDEAGRVIPSGWMVSIRAERVVARFIARPGHEPIVTISGRGQATPHQLEEWISDTGVSPASEDEAARHKADTPRILDAWENGWRVSRVHRFDRINYSFEALNWQMSDHEPECETYRLTYSLADGEWEYSSRTVEYADASAPEDMFESIAPEDVFDRIARQAPWHIPMEPTGGQ